MNRLASILCRSGIPYVTNHLYKNICTFGFKLSSSSTQLTRTSPTTKNFCTKVILDPNTNVIKDVILFKYENARLYKWMNFFAFAQFIFWNYLSYFSLTNLRDAPVPQDDTKEDLPFWRRINLGENKYRNGISILCFTMGYGILAASWFFTIRSVRFLVLRKGGQAVSFVTYTPFGPNRIMEVPIKYVSAEESRHAAKVTLPVKVKGQRLFYMLDMRGEFKNPVLFDQTVGLRRKL